MNIGKIPIISPVSSFDRDINYRDTQATVLQQFQTVQQAAALDSATLNFREVTIQKREETQQDEKREASNSVANENREREIRRELDRDRETSALVFKSIDVSTGEVVRQYPEEARLNLRAYLGSKEEAQLEEQSDA